MHFIFWFVLFCWTKKFWISEFGNLSKREKDRLENNGDEFLFSLLPFGWSPSLFLFAFSFHFCFKTFFVPCFRTKKQYKQNTKIFALILEIVNTTQTKSTWMSLLCVGSGEIFHSFEFFFFSFMQLNICLPFSNSTLNPYFLHFSKGKSFKQLQNETKGNH